jgi:hypothetical protein
MPKFRVFFEILKAGPEQGTVGTELPKDPKDSKGSRFVGFRSYIKNDEQQS